MKYCCCATPDHYALVARAGFSRIALPGSFVAACDEAVFRATVCQLSQEEPVCRSLNAFCPPQIALVGPAFDRELLREYAKKLAARASVLGVRAVGVGSPNSRRLPDGFDRAEAMAQWETALSLLSEIFAPYRIDVLAEPLCTLECNWMNTTDEVLEVVRRLDLPNLGMVFDMYHAFVMGETDEPLRRAMPYVRLAHIAHYVDGEKHYLRTDHMGDCLPYFKALKAAGFDGEIAVEATYDALSTALPQSLEILRRCEQAAAEACAKDKAGIVPGCS